MRRSARVVAVVTTTLALVGCTSEPGTDGPPVAENPPAADDRAAKPEVVLPEVVPDGLLVEDVVLGEGEPAVSGDVATVHFVAYSLATGEEIDSTWELAAPRLIPLVEGGAVPGFLEGVEGMQVGGRRSIIVPPALAYGDAGAPPTVGPGETLLFVVDLLDLDPS